jgi:hypothetical protein
MIWSQSFWDGKTEMPRLDGATLAALESQFKTPELRPKQATKLDHF